ncbi:MAG: hypothetical protein MJ176_02470 [Treponema sp.]|nr:hypothetical protein [Treponema sp.]
MKGRIIAVIIFLFLTPFAFADEVTVITILNARTTSYVKSEDSKNETIRLEGDVELSVEKGKTKTNVKAGLISYDRVTKILYADENVELTTENGSSKDQVYAKSLILNTSTLEGVFDDGKVVQTESDALNLPSGSTLVVFSSLFGKSENNTFAFKNSQLTFCDDEDPHWHIDSSRLWLLPGGEFAFLNALLYVGPVPVMYFPAFYLPKDELVFNPVLGYRTKQGFFIQTTTYLVGRKTPAKTNATSGETDSDKAIDSLYNFMKPTAMKEQVLEGLVLHNTDEDYKGTSSDYLKVLGDWYSNTGGLAGVEGSFSPKNTILSKITFGLDLGFSNTIFPKGQYYSNISDTGHTYYQTSNFLGVELPFRFKGNLEMGITKPFSVNLKLPFYSDPYFTKDFNNRSEDLNWITTIRELTNMKEENEGKDGAEVSSFAWSLSTSYSVPVPKFVKPYINTLSFTSSSNVSISAKRTSDQWMKDFDQFNDNLKEYSSRRSFYYPSHVNPFNFTFSTGGTLFQYPFAEKTASTSKVEYPVAISFTEEKPETNNEVLNNESITDLDVAKDSELPETTDEVLPEFQIPLSVPELTYKMQTETKKAASVPFKYSLGYSLSGDSVTQLTYDGNVILIPEDFQWGNYKSVLQTYRMPASVTSSASIFQNFLTVSSRFNYDSLWQKHPFVAVDETKAGYTLQDKNKLIKADYLSEKQKITNTNSVSLKPLTSFEMFEETAIVWDTSIKILDRKIQDEKNWDGISEPEYEYNKPDLTDPESLTSHKLSLVFATSEMQKKFKQTLTLSANLPPQLDNYTGTLNLIFPYVTASFSTGIRQKSKDEEVFEKDPFNENLSVSVPLFSNTLKLTQSYSYDLENDNAQNLKLNLSYMSFSFAYTMSWTKGYDFVEEGNSRRWKIREEEEFLPTSLSAYWSPEKKTFYSWKNRISVAPSMNTSLVADLLRPTNSYFTFSPSLTFRLNELLDVSFAATSRNSVIYRYVQSAMGTPGRVPGEENIFKDLFNSFAFADEAKRKASGFKIKSLDVDINHHLHDWKFQYKLKMEPRLITDTVTGRKRYDFNPLIQLAIVWNPMDNIKANITDKYGEWSFN